MIIKVTKEHEGKTILGVGTGNNAVRNGETPPVEIHVIKVKRKYFTACMGRSTYQHDLHCETGDDREGWGNGGYEFYLDKEAIDRSSMADFNVKIIRNYFGNWGRRNISLEDTEKILKIIGVQQ